MTRTDPGPRQPREQDPRPDLVLAPCLWMLAIVAGASCALDWSRSWPDGQADVVTPDVLGPDSARLDSARPDSARATDRWVVALGGTGEGRAMDIAVDSAGNAYVTGYFKGTLSVGTHESASRGNEDLFVVKLDTDGKVGWDFTAGGTGRDRGNAIALSSSPGHLWIAGDYETSAVFGSTTLLAAGGYDVFVARFDKESGGQPALATGGGSGADLGFGVAVDGDGNACITGRFTNQATFGTLSLTASSPSAGNMEMFVVKYSSNLEAQWALAIGGKDNDQGHRLALVSKKNIYVAGIFSDLVTLGSTTLQSKGSSDMLLAKVDDQGAVLSAVSAGTTGADEAIALAVDAQGNAYIGGYFTGELSFGKTSLSSVQDSPFLARFNADLKPAWILGDGSTSGAVNDIALGSSGDVYVTGHFSSALKLGTASVTARGGEDIFMARISSDGAVRYLGSAGGEGWDRGFGIALDAKNDAYICGVFTGSATFNSLSLTSPGTTDTDVFVWRTRLP